MNEKTKKFIHDAAFTTALSFLLINFFYVFGMLFAADGSAEGVFYADLFGKLTCIFLFSLSLGFLNRVFLIRRLHQVILRLSHFFLAALSFFFFLILLWYSDFAGGGKLSPKGALGNFAIFFLFYFLTLAVCALARKLTAPKKKEEYKSILK